MRRNPLAQCGLLISDAPYLRWTTRSLALGHPFLVCLALSFEVPQDRAQRPAFQVAAEEVVDLSTGHPHFVRVFEGFKDLVSYHVAGPIPEDQVGGLLGILP